MVETFVVEGDGTIMVLVGEGGAEEEVAFNTTIEVGGDEPAGDDRSIMTLQMTKLKYWEIHRPRL